MEEKEKDVLTKFFDIACTLTSTMDIDTLLKRIGDAAKQLTLANASSIMLVDDDKQHLFFKVATGEKGIIVKRMKIKIGEGIAGWVAQNKRPLRVNDVSSDPRFAAAFDKSSGFQTKSILGVPLLLGDELVGVAEVLNKSDNQVFTDDDEKILQSLASFASVSISNARIAENQKNYFVYMTEILVQAIEANDPRMEGHSWRVAKTSTMLARILSITGEDYKNLYYASLLHDIGYITGKKQVSPMGEGIYTIKQVDTEKMHPIYGFDTLNKINLLRNAAPIVRAHHENYDGTGFPDGLKGDALPVTANILAFAEYLDELTISGLDQDKISEIITANKGKKFYPEIVDAYLNELVPLQEPA